MPTQELQKTIPEVPEARELMSESETMKKTALALQVTDAATFTYADGMLGAFRALRKKIEAAFAPLVNKQKEALDKQKAALAEVKTLVEQHTQPLLDGELDIKNKMLYWKQQEQERLKKEQEDLEKTIKAQQETAKLDAAEKAEKRGDTKAAERILSTPTAPVPNLTAPLPKASHFSSRENWDFRIVDEAAIPRDYLSVDEVKIRRIVVAMKGATKIAGVEVFRADIPAGR